jgi:outer membrane protein OmpA-like peptidoglycan-associated protein
MVDHRSRLRNSPLDPDIKEIDAMTQRLSVLALGLLASAGCAAAPDCAGLQQPLRQSLEQKQFDAAAESLRQMADACPSGELAEAKRRYTDQLAKQANDLANQGDLDRAAALLDKAPAVSWMVHSVRGDIAAKRDDWREAAQQYRLAYELLIDPAHVEQTPAILAMQKKTYLSVNEAQSIYGKLDASLTRGGEAAILPVPRGMGVEQSIPVPFAYDRSDLTQEGKESATQLAAYLKSQTQLKQIILVGHTDPRGDDAYNLELSQRRAQTVADFLQRQGLAISIKAEGKGEAAPPELSDPGKYNPEQIWAIQRRVELQTD